MIDKDFSYEIKIKVSKETYKKWKLLRNKIYRITGNNNPSKTIEYAIIETLNIPDECLRYNIYNRIWFRFIF